MTLMSYINQGGAIMYVLLILNIFGVALMIYKFFDLGKSKKQIEQTATFIVSRIKENVVNSKASDQTTIEVSQKELNSFMSTQEKGLNTIKIIATISPLLGLLGTVLGVLLSFNKMAQSGMGDPTIFANGISLALVTTVAGLIVSIPHYIGHNYLIGIVDELEMELEKSILIKAIKK